MSRTMFVSFPGAATAIGLVESKRSIPPQGAMWLALPTAGYSPLMSCASGIAAQIDAGAHHQLGAGGGVFRGQSDREQRIGDEALELGRGQALRGSASGCVGFHCARSGWRDMSEP